MVGPFTTGMPPIGDSGRRRGALVAPTVGPGEDRSQAGGGKAGGAGAGDRPPEPGKDRGLAAFFRRLARSLWFEPIVASSLEFDRALSTQAEEAKRQLDSLMARIDK